MSLAALPSRATALRRVSVTARTAGAMLLDMLLPPRCAACDEAVERQGQFCFKCFGAARFIAEPACRCCGVPFENAGLAGPDRVCVECAAQPPAWRQARAAFVYGEFSRRLILPLKYGDRTEMAAVLGAHMARAGQRLLVGADVLVPVPLHRRRLRRRRYNQAALLCRALSRSTGVPFGLDVLRRVKATAPLAGLGGQDRLASLSGAIEVRETRRSVVAGRSVVLVDDVLTTGATASACAAALMAAGAASVDVLAAARTVRDG
ncbi:double zinc ribbon domain-containing protein [Rhizosaccharibacter radicis]|uniref:Double zinc ribbon domain-containing protein n=1 Tax=Rhizosaccharibacter radicis TaxID=2782605 RepID=A0ABT1VWG6_9PROT|nr:double zinc ribbon domain-containing protein [Acetobacteraceae bacterium KSS12]